MVEELYPIHIKYQYHILRNAGSVKGLVKCRIEKVNNGKTIDRMRILQFSVLLFELLLRGILVIIKNTVGIARVAWVLTEREV